MEVTKNPRKKKGRKIKGRKEEMNETNQKEERTQTGKEVKFLGENKKGAGEERMEEMKDDWKGKKE